LDYTLETGRTAFDKVHGSPFFDYLELHPEAGRAFDDLMEASHARETPAIVAAYDLTRVKTVVDVGGGNGSLLAALLVRHPHLCGILFDRAHVVARPSQPLRAAGLCDRIRTVAGDFFQAVPKGGDVYVLRDILHDWDDQQAEAILANCRKALGP